MVFVRNRSIGHRLVCFPRKSLPPGTIGDFFIAPPVEKMKMSEKKLLAKKPPFFLRHDSNADTQSRQTFERRGTTHISRVCLEGRLSQRHTHTYNEEEETAFSTQRGERRIRCRCALLVRSTCLWRVRRCS